MERNRLSQKKSYIPPEAHILALPDDIKGIENLRNQDLKAYLQSEAVKQASRRHRIRDGYCVREFLGKGVVVPVGRDTMGENQMTVLSPVGMFLWDKLEKEQTFGDLMTAVLAEYDISRDEAAADIAQFLAEMEACKCLVTVGKDTQ